MNIYNFGWEEFIRYVPAWNGLTAKAKNFFIARVGRQAAPCSKFQAEADELVSVAFVRFCRNGAMVSVSPRIVPFCRAIGGMARHPVFDRKSDLRALAVYLREHFSASECGSLVGTMYSYGDVAVSLARQTCRLEWLERFLAKKSCSDWEKEFLETGREPLFRSGEVFEQAKQILRLLMEGENPATYEALAAALAGGDALKLSGAIGALVQYGMIFPALSGRDLAPVVGIWPEIHGRLHRAKPLPPAPAKTAGERFSSALLMEDMTAILAACATEPLRLRGNDLEIFLKEKKKIEERLVAIPEWCLRHISCPVELRMAEGSRTLLQLKFADIRREKNGHLFLVTTAAGRGWLALSARMRLGAVLDALRKDCAREFKPHDFCPDVAMHFLHENQPMWRNGKAIDARPSVIKAFAGLSAEDFAPFKQFLDRAKVDCNPWAASQGRGGQVTLGNFTWATRYTEDELEDLWADVLEKFFTLRLFPLGGCVIGQTEKGELCLSLTGAGRYLLGEAESFRYGSETNGEVVVQPNFEIVFLSPSPAAEAAIARFSERIGRGVGLMFRITRETIHAAFVGGMDSAQTLECLRSVSKKTLPGNVEKQINDWFAQCRSVTFSTSVLFRCPNRETAMRVKAVAGHQLGVISDTVLELDDAGKTQYILKKLRKNGISPQELSGFGSGSSG